MLSYRKLAMRVLGHPLHTEGIDSPRPASQRAAAFILTAAMLTTLAAPAFADIWHIENGDITISAGESGNNVTQNNNTTYGDTNTIITNQNKDTASSHTVTIEAKDKDDKVEVTLKDVNIEANSGPALTSKGDVTLTLKGENHLTGGNGGRYGGSGITSNGSLTITGGENDSLTAQGGSSADGGSGSYGGDGIGSSSGGLTISGGTVNAAGGSGSYGGSGICSSSDDLTISGGTVNAAGGSGSYGGSGIYSRGGLTISGGTVTANGGGDGSNVRSGSGITSNGGVTISGGTVNAAGGSGSYGGNGIYSRSSLTISGGTVNATGRDGKDGYGGGGIWSGSGGLTISGGTVTANGGNGGSGSYGGDGIGSIGGVAISGGTVTANGGNGGNGGDGICSSGIDLSGSLELTAKAGSPSGRVLSQNGDELDLNTIKDKLGPGAKVTTTDANGKVNQVSIPRPVESEKPVIPEESSSSSDGGSATPSAPASPLPGLTVTDKDGQRISYTSTQSGNTLTVCVGRFTASFRISLAALRQLRAEGIETITFQTILRSTTLSVDELLAMGGEDAEAVLTHRFTDSSLTVG